MRRSTSWLVILVFAFSVQAASRCYGQMEEDQTVRAAEAVFHETMALPLSQIPESLLARAQGVAIIPNVIKGGFIVGARFGKGVLLIRNEQGAWQLPVFITLTGGNIGWQVGVQSTDIVLVFTTRKSIQGILSGTFTIGADAAVAAGPVGRQASAATNARLQAEIYSYSRSRGIFLGVSIDGSVIRVDQFANSVYYQSQTPGHPAVVPASATQLVQEVAARSMPATGPPIVSPTNYTQPAPQFATATRSEADTLRNQLAHIAPELYEILDPQWRTYLALPSEVFTNGPHPSRQVLDQTLARFETVNTNPLYRNLADQPRFRSTYGLLRHYYEVLNGTSSGLSLPPPPAPAVPQPQ